MNEEELFSQAVEALCEAREKLTAEELERPNYEQVAIEELMHGAQATSKTDAKDKKALHPGYRAHKERVNQLENEVIRALGDLTIRQTQLLRTVPPNRIAQLIEALSVAQLND